jgi:hypothetical protein
VEGGLTVNDLLFCDADENGNITDALTGVNIIPDRQYDYFFYGFDGDIFLYKVDVETRLLVLK